MSGDKRSVATDALEVLGTIIPGTKDVGRDAIHLATLAVTSDETMTPCQHVALTPDGKKATSTGKRVGIVDPFLTQMIVPGQKFLVVIYPRKIASLRHVWSHPDIPDDVAPETVKEVVKKVYVTRSGLEYMQSGAIDRLREIADRNFDVDVDVLLRAMDDGYLCDGGKFEGSYGKVTIPEEAWDLFEAVMGRRARYEDRPDDVYFSCSC